MKFTADTSQWIVTECRIGNSWTPKVQWQPSDLQAQHVCFFNTHSFSKPHSVTAVLTERAPNGNEDSNGKRKPSGNGKTSEKFVTLQPFCNKNSQTKEGHPHKHP